MSKFSGILGVRIGWETKNGLSTPVIKTYQIYGDLLQNSYRNNQGQEINDDIKINNRFSFIAPPELLTMFSELSTNQEMGMYIQYFGIKLKISEISFNPPRVTCHAGGIWNE